MAQGITGTLVLKDTSYGATLNIYYSETYDAATNTSNVAITKMEVIQSAWITGERYLDGTITINGSAAVSMSSHDGTHSVYVGALNTPVTVSGALGSVNVAHDADGSKSIVISASVKEYKRNVSGAYWSASNSKTVTLTKINRTFKLSISQGTGTTISVKRGSTTLSNGASITYGDVLTISASASTGYNTPTLKVNSSTFTSGNTHTVKGNVTVSATTTIKQYTITISAGTGTSITVKNGSTTISSGTKVNHGTVLSVSFSYSTGYTKASQSHSNGNVTITANTTFKATATKNKYTLTLKKGTGVASFTGGGTYEYGTKATTTATASTGYRLTGYAGNYADGSTGGSWAIDESSSKTDTTTWTMNSNRTITVSAELDTFTLTISAGSDTDITVKRGSTTLSNGATITYGDVLTITANATDGHQLSSLKVNGSNFTSGRTHTVSGNVTIVSSANLSEFLLTTSAGAGSIISVLKNGTAISNGAKVKNGDVLTIEFGAIDGYKVIAHNVNGEEFISGNTLTVSGDTLISSTARIRGVSIGNDSTFDTYVVYIGNGSSYEAYVPYIGNGETWELYGD